MSNRHPTNMRFSIIFENTGDSIPFEVVSNEDLFTFFVNKINAEGSNFFSVPVIGPDVEQKITHLHWALSKTNEVLYALAGTSFEQKDRLYDYLDQKFLNKTHADWVRSQQVVVNIDALRFSLDRNQAILGNKLHDQYPDEIRAIKLAEAMRKLGYIYPYEEVNLGVHRLESAFVESSLEFQSEAKWQVFDNPYYETMQTNNNIVNFAFNYTYVGRQYYDKFCNFDLELENDDHYNFEQLEVAFQVNLRQPQTIPFSSEFLEWTNLKCIRPVSRQIPIANVVDLCNNLQKYREILVKNSRSNNRASLVMEK